MTATIVTVCTGNICRSPAAELLLQRALGDHAVVSSAGTHALEGHPIPDQMLAQLALDGFDGAGHRGRLLTEQVMREADAIITMTRAHRQIAVQLAPFALKKTFTLAELAAAAGTGAQLTATTPAERVRELYGSLAAHRHVLAGYELDDVPDPYRRSTSAYRQSYSLIRGGVNTFVPWVLGDAGADVASADARHERTAS